MTYRFCVLLLGLLAAAFIGKSDATIDCFQCSDCPDADKLPEVKACKAITLGDELKKLAPPGLPIGEFKGEPLSCFKLIINIQDKEMVSRGCSGKPEEEACKKEDIMEVCACTGNACNVAPKSFVPSAISTFFLTVFIFMATYM